ncbi:MAG: response regulator [bacterium]|jgi:DNA-binding NtrC family response regulator|nr:response regulator [bacterium]
MILIVDDEELVSGTYQDFLRLEGYSVEIANSVAVAREKLSQYRFDLVVTDYKMPREDGLDLIHYLNDNFPEIKVVMITGFPEKKATHQAFRDGIVEFLFKPVEREELVITIKKLMSQEPTVLNDSEDATIDEILKDLNESL